MKQICASWLQVSPIRYTLRVNEETPISLTVFIDKASAQALFASKNINLQDILVMRLENGRDHFIPCTAKYQPRVFGVSIDHLLTRKGFEHNLIDFGDSHGQSGCPDGVPQEIHRIVSALRTFGPLQISFNEMVDYSLFGAIRTALENNAPQDLTLIKGVTAFSLYSALLYLLDALTEPLIPTKHKEACLHHCSNPQQLWLEVAKFDPVRIALIEYLTTYLREFVSQRREDRDQISSWADVFFHDTSAPITQRQLCLLSLIDYSKDVALFHSSASTNSLPNRLQSLGNQRLQVRLPPPVPPHRGTMANSQSITRSGSNMF